MKKTLLIDNYDSFVYNVLHLVKKVTDSPVDIFFNDKIPFGKLDRYSHIILSPGPGVPSQAGDMLKLIEISKESHSILGICLGHQAIAQHFGAGLINLTHPLHGHKSILSIVDSNDPLVGEFDKNSPCIVGLYHSWAVNRVGFPQTLSIGSCNEDNIIMSLYHRSLAIYGVQFHPESVITNMGERIMSNYFYGSSVLPTN